MFKVQTTQESTIGCVIVTMSKFNKKNTQNIGCTCSMCEQSNIKNENCFSYIFHKPNTP